jgi:hypothetical protein
MNQILNENEISIREILDYLKKKKNIFFSLFKIILLSTISFAFVGFLEYKTADIEFESKATLLNEDQESSASGNSSMKDLAIRAVLGQDEKMDQKKEDLYSLIVYSNPFLLELSHKKIKLNNQNISIYQFFVNKKESISLFDKVTQKIVRKNKEKDFYSNIENSINYGLNQAFTSNAIVYNLSSDDKRIINILKSKIKLIQSGKLIYITVKMPDANLSAQANKELIELLVKYATRIKLAKQLENISFLEERTKEAWQKYNLSQQRVAGFKDNNYNLIFETIQTKNINYQNDLNLYSSVYNQLFSQLEQAKIQLKKDSPLFTFVEPIYIPEGKFIDNSVIYQYATIGFLCGILFFIIKIIIPNWLFRLPKFKRN